MENLELIMLNDKTELFKKRRNDTIATKIFMFDFSKLFFLRNKKTIINKLLWQPLDTKFNNYTSK